MRGLREQFSSRVRASLRGVLPAVVTLAVLLAGRVLLTVAFPTGTEAISVGEILLVRACFVGLYLVMIWLAVRLATQLDHRQYTDFGLAVSPGWLRDFAAGTVASSAGILLAVAWGVHRGFRAVDPSIEASGPGGPLYLAFALVVFVLYLLLGNIYEEIVYRGIMLQNFAEGLHARGLPPRVATGLGAVGSLLLFGVYHVPLRPSPIIAIDAALTGTTFVVAYLVTGELGLAIGVHFGRTTVELLTGVETIGVTIPSIVEVTRDTLAANLEVRLLELGLIILFVLAWIALTDRNVQVAESIYASDTANVD